MKRMLMNISLLVVISILYTINATGNNQQSTLQMPSEYMYDNKDKIMQLFEQRLDKSKLEEAIALLEESLVSDKSYDLGVLLSRSYYFLAEFENEKDRKLQIYLKGVKAGEIALNTLDKYVKVKTESNNEGAAIQALSKDNIEAIYWTAANLARWSKFASFTKKVSSKARVRYLWDKVFELDPNYFYGGAYRFYGGYYSLVPTITGEQDPKKSKEMFDKCVEIAPEYLETKVLYAETYCTHAAVKDRALFKKMLNDVLDFDLKSHTALIPENTIAKEKAKKLLDEENSLFE